MHWSIEICVDGDQVLVIESNSLGGKDDVQDIPEVHEAFRALAGFLGYTVTPIEDGDDGMDGEPPYFPEGVDSPEALGHRERTETETFHRIYGTED